MCGASSQQNQIEQQQQQYYSVLTQQAQQEFAQSTNVFNDIFKAFAPIVAAGPNQMGFSADELQGLDTSALTQVSQAYTTAGQAARQQAAASGGSNFIPSGASIQQGQYIAGAAAGQQSTELQQIQQADAATGRQNFFTAEGDLAAATGTFNASTGAAGAANSGGSAAANTANEIAQENNSWMTAVSGALGGIAGGVVSGGMSNLGKGVGFFGSNAPAPAG